MQLEDLGIEIRSSTVPRAGTTYDLYSVPAFPTGEPETLDGSEIESSKRVVMPGDLLLCKINPRINRVWVVNEYRGREQLASTEWLVLRTGNVELTRYLTWYLRTPRFREWIKLAVEGATGSHTRAKSGPILQQLIPTPPAQTRARIVEAIEKQFSRLDAAERWLADSDLNFRRLKARLLNAAATGPWPTLKLGSIVTSIRNGIFVSRPAANPPGIPIFRISAVRPLNLDKDDVRYAPSDTALTEKSFVEDGDLLFTRYSGNSKYVGSCAVVKGLAQPTLHPDKLIRVVLDQEIADPDFVCLAVNTGEGRRHIEQCLKTTAGQVGIAGGELRNIEIRLPELRLQREIVDAVRVDVEALDRTQSSIARGLSRLAVLRRAILHKAFSGDFLHRGDVEISRARTEVRPA